MTPAPHWRNTHLRGVTPVRNKNSRGTSDCGLVIGDATQPKTSEDAALPETLRLDENRERTVVHQRDLHHRPKLARFDVQAPAS